jgi:hypothetical protein
MLPIISASVWSAFSNETLIPKPGAAAAGNPAPTTVRSKIARSSLLDLFI